jgi:branched-chain amino acid transport system permease protein
VADLQSLEAYLLVGVLTATAAAALAGVWCVRATRIHFTILTLAFAELVRAVFVSGAVYRPLGDFGKGLFFVGDGGLYIRRFTMLGTDPPPERFIPTFYYVILLAFFLSLGVLWRVGRSPFGMALRAIRDNDVRAALVGVPVRLYRWRAFVISGAITGLAVALYGQLDRQVTPEQLHSRPSSWSRPSSGGLGGSSGRSSGASPSSASSTSRTSPCPTGWSSACW